MKLCCLRGYSGCDNRLTIAFQLLINRMVSGCVCFCGIVFVILIVARGHTEVFRTLGLIQPF